PALAVASAPWLIDIAGRYRAQKTLFVLACSIGLICITAGIVLGLNGQERQRFMDVYDLDAVVLIWPRLITGTLAVIACLVVRPARGFAAYGLTVAASFLVVSFWLNPLINDARSGARLMRHVQAMATDVGELGLVAYREQYLLYVTRPVTTFGHAR